MNELNILCKEVQNIARLAGSFLQHERSSLQPSMIQEKSSHNFVTEIDKASEQLIVKNLAPLLPNAGFLTEEGTAGHDLQKYRWVIDPLDGTTNYIRNNAPYCVSIALTENDRTLLGVVFEPCRNECFHAVINGKAYLNDEEIHVSQVDSIEHAFVALGLPYRFDDYRPTALHLIRSLYGHSCGCRVQGAAAVELCYIAAGRFDARIEAYLSPWDVAAGALILTQAGGCISDFSGKDQWKSGAESLASNGIIHKLLLNIIQQKQ
jgi:myo-inositol-1(or 4)-monophosphatase